MMPTKRAAVVASASILFVALAAAPGLAADSGGDAAPGAAAAAAKEPDRTGGGAATAEAAGSGGAPTAPAEAAAGAPAAAGEAGAAAVAPAAPAQGADAQAAQPAAEAAEVESPDKVVEKYLKAMQDQHFSDAYDCVSKTLKAGKSREEWAKEQQYIVQMGEVKIFGFHVFPAAIQADGTARVPNILKSQDKFLNQLGLDEYELYELIKEDGQWKIDQQTLVEGADRGEYFPDDAVQP